jgi:hypothetical protein
MSAQDSVCHVETIEVRGLEEVTPGCLFGTTEVFGCNMHVSFIRVRDGDQDVQLVDGDCDAQERMNDLIKMDPGGPFEAVELEGFEGTWVPILTPFQR